MRTEATETNMVIPATIIPERILSAAQTIYGNSLALTLFEIPTDKSLTDDKYLAEQLLAPREREVLKGFRLEKRQQQWLAGRLCAKQAVCEHSRIADLASIAIFNREDGSPYVLINDKESPHLHLSISHSGKLAAGLVADRYCGIDIQEERETLLNVRQRFCSSIEDTLLCQNVQFLSPLQRLNLLWSCKESIRKMLNHRSIPGFLDLCCDKVIRQHEDLFLFRFNMKGKHHVFLVLCGVLHGYALALCVLKGGDNA